MPTSNYSTSGKRRKSKKKKRSETTAIVLIVVLVILIIIIFILAIISLGQGHSSSNSRRHTNVVSIADMPEAQQPEGVPQAEAQPQTEAAPAADPGTPADPADPAALTEEATSGELPPLTDTATEAPTEEAQAATEAAPAESHAVSYVQALTAAHVDIYAGPGSSYGITGSITDKGSYTIVEEATDSSGSKWGKLKSGAGWINLGQATGGSVPAASAGSTDSAPDAAPAAPSSSRGGTSLGSSSSAAD